MSKRTTTSILILTSTLMAAGAAQAQQTQAQPFTFTGSRENVNPLAPPGTGRCAPTHFNTVSIAPGAISSTGASNLESFTSTQSHCISSPPPTPLIDGRFTYTFRGGDTIFGVYAGNAAATATPGTFNATENLVITGGTGRFIGASGTLTSTGTLQVAGGNGNFRGDIAGSILATNTTASGQFATALGVPAAATGDYSTALGAFSLASGPRSLAAGSFADAIADGATALGNAAFAAGVSSTALGQGATATGTAGTAIGHNTNVTGLGAAALGVRAQATGAGAVSVGRLSGATADGATALGAGASAAHAGSTALGAGAATTAANQVSLGGTGSSVRVGDIAASTAAQSGAVDLMTVDASGTLGRNTTLMPAVQALQNAVFANRKEIDGAYEGVALALAMESPQLPPGARYGVSGGVGYYGDRVAASAAFAARLGERTSFSAGAGLGFESGKVGARAGLQHAW